MVSPALLLSVVPSSAALASPGIWLEMQTFWLHPTPTEPESGFSMDP